MKKIIFSSILLLTASCLLQAGSMEDMRSSSGDINIDAASLRSSAATSQFEIQPTPIFSETIANFVKLLFGPDGDVEIANKAPEAPRVDGALSDDDEEETYSGGEDYKPLTGEVPGDISARKGADFGAPEKGFDIPEDLKAKALEYYRANSSRITNKDFIGIIDFAKHSSIARFYIVDMRSGSSKAIHVAHGKGSDTDGDGYANKFSNTPDSKASSLGFYLTGATCTGKHGKSMRLHGLSSTNSNALSRAVVIHEATYVQEANVKEGRSFGCPAVAASQIGMVISSLKGGALIYAGLSNSKF